MSYLNLRNVFITSARRVTVNEPKKGDPPVERVAEMVTSPLVLAWEREMPGASAAALRRRAAPQRFVVIAFNPRESDIVLRKELPLLLWNSLQWFQADGEPATQAAPGTAISLAAGPESNGSATALVTTPTGRVEPVSVDPETGSALFADTSVAGVYRYRIGSRQDAFAVNLGSRAESSVAPQDLNLKAEVVSASDLAAAHPGGRALWPWLLLAAGILLAVEAVLFHRRVFF
jgi:hypothetical protein